ncbi:MAG: hypothetical protein P9F19_15915 [Candidatus Contendobacter sp.]|nr:hypothetical protein [Candidatus Contendobacter sp.]MDG4558858.1 hypothetical protein [Candidatus Contendobacter sp.]
MKIGPIDFRQPSTWRGLLGFLALIGWNLSPELREQIATLLATALCAIELFRNEYARHRPADVAVERLRVSAMDQPTRPNPADPDPSHFGGDR